MENFKVLSNAFASLKIQKYIDVPKLVKCKYQDNLEFIQWFKRFFDLNCGDRANDYDALERRKQAKTSTHIPKQLPSTLATSTPKHINSKRKLGELAESDNKENDKEKPVRTAIKHPTNPPTKQLATSQAKQQTGKNSSTVFGPN